MGEKRPRQKLYRSSTENERAGISASPVEMLRLKYDEAKCNHIIKGVETRTALMSVLRSPGLASEDREIVLQMLRDLQYALNP